MNFNVLDQKSEKNKRRNKDQKLLMIAFCFFTGLSVVLMIIYFATQNNNKTTRPIQNNPVVKPPTVVEKDEEEPEVKETKESYINLSSTERPLAIVLDNENKNNIHAGLQDSYLNYELPIEGGGSRILALYKDKQVSIVGPVESANHYFIDYAIESNAVLVSFGQSELAKSNLTGSNINNINGREDTKSFAKDKNLESPHNVFVSTIKLRDEFSSKSFSKTSNSWKLFNYSSDEVILSGKDNAAVGRKASISYGSNHTVNYTYDSINKYYLRSQDGKAHKDRKTNEQLHYKNIIIMRVETRNINNNLDIITAGRSDGFYITNGFSVPIKWSKDSRSAKTAFTYGNGEAIKLNDGNTFIHVVLMNSNIQIN